MKKFVIAILLAVFAIGAQAQIVSSRSSLQTIEIVQKEHYPLRFEWYVKAGLNMMSTRWAGQQFNEWGGGDDADITGNKTKIGFNFSFGFMSHFRPSLPSDFYWGAEIGLSQVGGGFDNATRYNNNNTTNYSAYSYTALSAYIGPTIGWKKSLSDDIQLDFHFSPEFLAVIGSPDDLSYIETSTNYKGETYTNNRCRELYRGLPNFALRGGVGVWFGHFNVDISYRGTIDIGDDVEDNNLIVSVGYRF